jgi:ABC-type glutathione transport system ATPase component
MPSFNILKKSEIDKTFRVAKIISDFDINLDQIHEEFKGEIILPDKWKIGLIVGSSGTGKTTIAKELFGNYFLNNEYTEKSVIDDIDKKITVDEITKTFYSVGFGSVPSWLKPYKVLSNGEKMRVDLAKGFIEKDFFIFDEFTSVVDRTVAQTICMAIKKSINNKDKKIILISCHYDIVEWLQPDWILNTNDMKSFFMTAHDQKENLLSKVVGVNNGLNLANIII